MCSVLWFLVHFCHCVLQMEWIQERVIKFVEGYKGKEKVWDPKQPLHFNKIKKQDACDELVKDIN